MNDLTTTTENEVSANDPAAAYRNLADEAGGGGDFLKFKKGKFVKGSNDEEAPLGTRYAVNMIGLERGYIKFSVEPPEKRMARPSEPKITRESLGETDDSLWEKDDNGNPQDPWTPTWEIPLRDIGTGEELVFATSSTGGINALGRLCSAYVNRLAMGGHAVPIIALGASSYKHKRFGDVDVPTLRILSWQKEEDLVAGKADGLDDQIPF